MKLLSPHSDFVLLAPTLKNTIQGIVFSGVALEIPVPFYSLHSYSSSISEC